MEDKFNGEIWDGEPVVCSEDLVEHGERKRIITRISRIITRFRRLSTFGTNLRHNYSTCEHPHRSSSRDNNSTESDK